MSGQISGRFLLPHPPAAVAEVGGDSLDKIRKTIAGFETVSQKIAALKPETVIVITMSKVTTTAATLRESRFICRVVLDPFSFIYRLPCFRARRSCRWRSRASAARRRSSSCLTRSESCMASAASNSAYS